MIIRRRYFFLALFSLLIIPFVAQKIIWLAGSKMTTGTMSFIGKSFSGQMDNVYSVIWFMHGKDTIWFNGRNNIFFEEGEAVPIRYHRSHPRDSNLNVFLAILGDTLVYGGIPVLILLAIFIHPGIVPYRSRVQLSLKKPFIQVI
jgi:hypothetical protein